MTTTEKDLPESIDAAYSYVERLFEDVHLLLGSAEAHLASLGV